MSKVLICSLSLFTYLSFFQVPKANAANREALNSRCIRLAANLGREEAVLEAALKYILREARLQSDVEIKALNEMVVKTPRAAKLIEDLATSITTVKSRNGKLSTEQQEVLRTFVQFLNTKKTASPLDDTLRNIAPVLLHWELPDQKRFDQTLQALLKKQDPHKEFSALKKKLNLKFEAPAFHEAAPTRTAGPGHHEINSSPRLSESKADELASFVSSLKTRANQGSPYFALSERPQKSGDYPVTGFLTILVQPTFSGTNWQGSYVYYVPDKSDQNKQIGIHVLRHVPSGLEIQLTSDDLFRIVRDPKGVFSPKEAMEIEGALNEMAAVVYGDDFNKFAAQYSKNVRPEASSDPHSRKLLQGYSFPARSGGWNTAEIFVEDLDGTAWEGRGVNGYVNDQIKEWYFTHKATGMQIMLTGDEVHGLSNELASRNTFSNVLPRKSWIEYQLYLVAKKVYGSDFVDPFLIQNEYYKNNEASLRLSEALSKGPVVPSIMPSAPDIQPVPPLILTTATAVWHSSVLPNYRGSFSALESNGVRLNAIQNAINAAKKKNDSPQALGYNKTLRDQFESDGQRALEIEAAVYSVGGPGWIAGPDFVRKSFTWTSGDENGMSELVLLGVAYQGLEEAIAACKSAGYHHCVLRSVNYLKKK